MNNANQPAFGYGFCTADGSSHSEEKGLTKREYFAAMAMQGILSNSPDWNDSDISVKWVSEASIKFSDELLKQLEK